jgi:ubiquinone/menaquinone biosynthesis C-methylase UbiE
MAETNVYETYRPRLRERIAVDLEGCSTILDFGCGACGLTAFLAERLRVPVVGVDLQEEAFGTAQREATERHLDHLVTCVRADAANLEQFEDGSFDGAVSVHVLHELADPRKTLREVLRVVAPGGRLVNVDFPAGSEASRLWGEHYMTPAEAEALLAAAGAESVACELIAEGNLMYLTARAPAEQSRRR